MCGYFCIGFIDFMFKDNSVIATPLNNQQFRLNKIKGIKDCRDQRKRINEKKT